MSHQLKMCLVKLSALSWRVEGGKEEIFFPFIMERKKQAGTQYISLYCVL